MSEENKKINFFKTAIKSVKDLDKYEDFALELPKDAFKYLLKLILVFTIIITLFYSYKIVGSLGEIYNNLKNIIPEFSYSQGILEVNSEEPIIIDEYDEIIGNIIIDTNIEDKEIETYKEHIDNSSLVLLILKDKCIITSKGASGQVSYNYSDVASSYNIGDFNKQDIINYIEGYNIISMYTSIYLAMFIYLFMIYFISIFIDVLLLALLANIVARLSRMKLKFVPSLNIAIHSITLPIVLNLIYIIVNLLTGFNIKYFGLMYNTISYIYVVVAILMIRTDFINRQMELIKIAEEQEKIKEELKQQKEKEKEKDNNKDKEPQKPKKDKEKKENKKEDDGELENGVNPSVIEEKH